MIPNYIKRSLETVLKKAVSEFPAAVFTGPRQSGKTTLLKAIFGKKFDFVSLEPPDIRATVTSRPTSSETSARCAKLAISPNYRAS